MCTFPHLVLDSLNKPAPMVICGQHKPMQLEPASTFLTLRSQMRLSLSKIRAYDKSPTNNDWASPHNNHVLLKSIRGFL